MKLAFRLIFLFSFFFLWGVSTNGQVPVDTQQTQWQELWLRKKEDFKLDLRLMVQLWSIYSIDQQVFDEETQSYQAVDDRFNVNLRRARMVVRGNPYPRLKYTLALFYDLAGRDLLSASIGGSNPAQPNFGIWDGFFQFQLSQNNESIWLTGGWFRPQFQRESITSGWSVNSFEKSMSQNYVRRHLTGIGPGRAAGINVGGLIQGESIGLNYNLGVFNPLYTGEIGQTVGRNFSPLLVGRTVITIGDPELTNYKIGYQTNYFNQRKGLSLDMNVSLQGQTDLFDQSIALGPGFLFNWGPWNIDGEWIWMSRDGTRNIESASDRVFSYQSNTGHFRLGYNLIVGKYMLEPTFMLMQFNGGQSSIAQADAAAVGAFSGNERTYDLGLNWYLDRRNLKLMMHYTWRNGDPGAAGDGARVNQFFNQNGVGAIRRGNWLGIGFHAIF